MLILKLCRKYMTFHEGTVYDLELEFLIEFCSEYLLNAGVQNLRMPLQKEFQPNVTLQIIVVSKAKRATNFTDSNILFLSLLSCTYVRTILQYYCSSVLFLALLVSLKYYQTVHYINNVLSIQSIGSFCKKPQTSYVDISLLYNLMIIRVKKT